ILYEPRFVRVPTEDDPDPPIRVTTPQDGEFDVHDAGLKESVAREHREPVFLFKTSRGNFDSQHLSLFSLATARALAGKAAMRSTRVNFAPIYTSNRSTDRRSSKKNGSDGL
ncbi:MAG TPA: hypothetical protein VIX58_09330, partial [Anaerolineae bacterium]